MSSGLLYSPGMKIDGVLKELRAACKAAGSQRAFADRLGVYVGYISAVLAGTRPPSQKLLDALDLEEDGMRYRRKKR